MYASCLALADAFRSCHSSSLLFDSSLFFLLLLAWPVQHILFLITSSVILVVFFLSGIIYCLVLLLSQWPVVPLVFRFFYSFESCTFCFIRLEYNSVSLALLLFHCSCFHTSFLLLFWHLWLVIFICFAICLGLVHKAPSALPSVFFLPDKFLSCVRTIVSSSL